MSNVTPQRPLKEDVPHWQQHPTSIDFSNFWARINFVSTPPAPDPTPHITKINYQCVAGGGFGDVYRCRYLNGSTSQDVAVKALRFAPDEDTKKKYNKMVRRELGVWKILGHNNIVSFLGIAYGFGMEGAMSLVSLWMPNETLPKFLATHGDKLDEVHRLQILLDVAKGLDYLHSFPIVHGDLNSNNVLLDANYTARLADFGYTSLMGNIPEALGYLQRSTARPGALRWIAPEQIDLQGSSIRTTVSDIYSFGCVALEVLSGKQPWSEVLQDAAVVLRLYLGHNPSRPESRSIGDLHWCLIHRCWSPLQERPSAAVIIHFIQRFLSDYPSSMPLCDLFIFSSSQGTNWRANPEPNIASARSLSPLRTTMSLLSPPNPPLAQDHPSRPTDFAVSTMKSYLLRVFNKICRSIVLKCSALFKFIDLRNKVKRDSSTPTYLYWDPQDPGKSWFTNAATECNEVKVNKYQHCLLFTRDVQAIRCELTDEAKRDTPEVKNIIFVDTPSFLAEYDDLDPHKAFKEWFNMIKYKPGYVGMIYMHRVETDPAHQPIEAHLQELCKVRRIGDALVPQPLLVVASCDKISVTMSQSKIRQRMSDLRDQVDLLRHSTDKWQLSSMHEELFQGEPEVAWRAVEELFRYL